MLIVEFEGGPSGRWPLPPKGRPEEIRAVRDEAARFAEGNGATEGQVAAVKKALRQVAYHVSH